MTDTVNVLLRVRYAECDAQQVVFNSRYAEYADLAATEYMRALVGGYTELVKQGYDNQLVNMNISWQSPAKFDDVLNLATHVTHVGNTSFNLNIEITEYNTKRAIAIIDIVYVMVDATTLAKTPIPNALKERLLTGPESQVIDLAGIRDIQAKYN